MLEKKQKNIIGTIEKGDILCKIDNFEIDFKGETKVDWYYEAMPINIVINRCLPNTQIQIEFWSKNRNKYIKEKCNLYTSNLLYPIRHVLPKFEKIDFEIFAGCTFMNFCLNHSDYLTHDTVTNNSKEIIIITHIYSASYANKINVMSSGDFVKKINNIYVSNINQLRIAFLKPITLKNKKKFIKIETTNNNIIIYNLKSCIEEQLFLAETENYTITQVTQSYLDKSKNKTTLKKK